MKSTRSIALIAFGCAAIIAVAVALRPAGSSDQALAAAQAAPTAPDSGVTSKFLSFGGTSTVKLSPDTAQVTVSVQGDGDSSGAALNIATAKLNKILTGLNSLNSVSFKQEDLVTGQVNTYKDWNENRPNHWFADQSLTVTLHDVAKAGSVIAAISAAGGDNVNGPSFSLADQRAAYRQALREAIIDARTKADVAAEAMGAKVTGVISITENGGSQSPTIPYAEARGSVAKDSVQAPTIQPGSIEVLAAVTVVFGYEPKA